MRGVVGEGRTSEPIYRFMKTIQVEEIIHCTLAFAHMGGLSRGLLAHSCSTSDLVPQLHTKCPLENGLPSPG